MPSNIDPLLPGSPWSEIAAKAADDLRRPPPPLLPPMGAVVSVERRRPDAATPSPCSDGRERKVERERDVEGKCKIYSGTNQAKSQSQLAVAGEEVVEVEAAADAEAESRSSTGDLRGACTP